MKRRHYGRSRQSRNQQHKPYAPVKNKEYFLQQGTMILNFALEQRLNTLETIEGKENLCHLMKLSHQRFVEELILFPERRILQDQNQAFEVFEKLQTENPTRNGKLWIAFRAYRSLTLYLAEHKKKRGIFVDTYVKILEESGKSSISYYEKQDVPYSVEELLQADFFDIKTYVLGGLYGVYSAYETPKEITKLLQPLLNIPPKEEYPLALSMERKFYIHVGGTNTGKTYGSIQKLKDASTGYYLAPLRLLALEIQEELRDHGVDCGLLTGEEEDLSPHNTHLSSTVEKGNLSQVVEVAVLDECQMIADEDRGYAWTRAILGCPAKEIHCCVAPEGLEILEKVIAYSGCVYEIQEHERLVPLRYLKEHIPLEAAQSGDAFVAFSRREVLRIAKDLGDVGIKASVIYGALPYQARKLQMKQFLSGKTKVIVATDAIGMGLNLPIQRVIFTEKEKFDGKSKRKLTTPEVRQIGGRAGRFGKYPEGFVASISQESSVKDRFYGKAPSLTIARLGFSQEILTIDYPLADVLKAWQKTDSPEPFLKTSVERHIKLIDMMESCQVKLSKEKLFQAINIPFNEDKEELFQKFLEYLQKLELKTKDTMLPFPSLQQKRSTGKSLMDYELFDKQLDLYYSFSAMFQFSYEKDRLRQEKTETSQRINELLIIENLQK